MWPFTAFAQVHCFCLRFCILALKQERPPQCAAHAIQFDHIVHSLNVYWKHTHFAFTCVQEDSLVAKGKKIAVKNWLHSQNERFLTGIPPKWLMFLELIHSCQWHVPVSPYSPKKIALQPWPVGKMQDHCLHKNRVKVVFFTHFSSF